MSSPMGGGVPPVASSLVDGVWPLPVRGPRIRSIDPELVDAFRRVSAATATTTLHRMGITKTFIQGPRTNKPGARAVGRAVTLQYMPMREDVYYGEEAALAQGREERTTTSALWQVLDLIEPGDFLVVQAYGSLKSGVVGEMLAHHLHNRGAVGLIADGGVRDTGRLAKIDLPVWSVGSTPHYSSQGELQPWGYHVPIAVGGVLVLPGDLIVADDDGAVVVPINLAQQVLDASTTEEEREIFSRMKLSQGGLLAQYYPLDEVGRAEYEQWIAEGRPVASAGQ